MTASKGKAPGKSATLPPGFPVGAGHTSELFYLFYDQARERPLDADELDLARTRVGMRVDFGRNSDPMKWPPYLARDREVVPMQLPAVGGINW